MAGCCLECGLVALWLLPTVEVLRPCLPACWWAGAGTQRWPAPRPPGLLVLVLSRLLAGDSLEFPDPLQPPCSLPCPAPLAADCFPRLKECCPRLAGPRLPFNDWTECPASHTLSSSEAAIPLQSHPPRLPHTALILACSGLF